MQLIEQHAYEMLARKGYGNCRLRYHFGDDDRVCFFGRPDLKRLASRFLMARDRAVVDQMIGKGFELLVSAPNGRDEPKPQLSVELNEPDSLNSTERLFALTMANAAIEDVNKIARRIEDEGRALIEAGQVAEDERELITFKTQTVTYRVRRVPGNDVLGVLGDYDHEAREHMIRGNLKYADILCQGVDANGEVVVEARIQEVTEYAPRPSLPAVALSALHTAIARYGAQDDEAA
jgi:hypothetical protein